MMLTCAVVSMLALLCCQSAIAQEKGEAPNAPQFGAAVEAEETVYTYEAADNGSAPMWCYGSTCLVRIGDDVFASGIEVIKDAKPLNNVRWLLFKRTADGWKLQQADETGRTREPCPLGASQSGKLFMSVNPTLVTDPEAAGGPARPEILQFDPDDAAGPYKTILPQWNGEPQFTEHSYRTFAADGATGEVALFQNIGTTHSEWAFMDAEGGWTSGQLHWPLREDTSISPYGSKNARCNYPNVAIRERSVHFCGAAAYNKWSRIRGPEDEKLYGRQWGGRWRRLLYTWTPDITKEPFAEFIEIANTMQDGGWLFPGDMWVSPDGTAHILWFEHPIHWQLRSDHFPDIKRVLYLKYAQVKDGKVTLRSTLVEDGGDVSGEIPGGRGNPRLHVTPDNRMFIIYYVRGKSADGRDLSENRMMQIYADGTHSAPLGLKLEHPLNEFFTATPRGGSAPCDTLDMLGTRADAPLTMGYARIRIQ